MAYNPHRSVLIRHIDQVRRNRSDTKRAFKEGRIDRAAYTRLMRDGAAALQELAEALRKR